MTRKKHIFFQLHGNPRPSKLTKKRQIVIGLAVVFVISSAIFYHLISKPVEGREVASSSLKTVTKKAKVAQPETPSDSLSSPYFSLSLPPGYRLQAGNQSSPGLLYQQTLLKPSAFGSLVIAIALKSLPEGGLSADSSYITRIQQPGHYSLSYEQIKGEKLSVATDKQSGSMVVFWPHGSYLATIGVTAGVSNPSGDSTDINRAIQPLLEAWQWR